MTAVRGIDGAVTNYVGAFSDTTDERRQQEARLRASFEPGEQEKLYGLILDTLPISVFVKDETQHYLMVNDYAAAFIGVPKEQVRGRTDYDLFPAQTSERLRDADQSVIDGLTHVIDENVVTLRGAEFFLLAHKRGVELGGRRLLIGASIDISSRRLAEQRLADEREILELIAANAGQPLILDTICQRIERFLHGGFASILVLDDEGRHLRHGAAPNLPAAYVAAVDGLEIGPDVGSCGSAAYLAEPVLVEDIAADPHWLKYRELAEQHSLRACWSTPVFSADHRVLGTFAIYFRSPRRPTELDLDLIAQGTRLAAIAIERARASATLHRMATVDTLTGLPNRQHFFSLAQRELSLVARNHQPLAVFMIDIDHFKRINDSHGHAAGDRVLRGVAGTINDSIRGTDVSGRLGGEEFVVLLPDTDQVTAVLVAERLRKRVGSLRFDIDRGGSCGATISIGIAAFREGDDFDRLLSRADEALYLAKNGGRDQVRQI
jgi:diguanylate cyclase (GGDEF)-like protein/PAS domain S-box-containing protein